MTALFRLEDVRKSFGARRALDDVSLRIDRGEFVALIGPSGSGKSTLLRTLNGLTRIDPGTGRVEAFGSVLQAEGRLLGARRTRARIGFVFQQFNLVGRMSLFGNVLIGALPRVPLWRALLNLWPVPARAEALDALGRVGIAEYAGQRAQTLSGGQQQRGAIARVLVQRAEAVLADEPVASLDPASSRRVMEILSDLNRADGLTVVVTLHQVDHALRYARRVLALRDGRLVFDGAPGEVTPEILAGIYGEELEAVVGGAGLPRAAGA